MNSRTLTSAFVGSSASAASAGKALEVAPASATSEKRGKLLYKLLAASFVLSLAPLLLTGFQLIHVGESYIQKQIIGVKLGIAQKIASNVTNYLDDKRNTLQVIHKSSDFLSMNPRLQTEALSTVMNAYPVFMSMTVLDLNGREMATVNRVGRLSPAQVQREEMKALRSIRSLGDYRSDVSRSPEGYPQMTIGVPIERIPGRPIGVLLGVVNLIDLSSLVKDIVIDKKGYAYIVDLAHFQMVAHPDVQTLMATETPAEILALEQLARQNKDAFEGPQADNGAIEFAAGNNKFLATYATVPKLNWKVFVQQPTAEAYQASAQMRREIFKVLVLVILGTIVIGLLASQWIVKRVHQLQTAIEQVGEGNFDISQVPTSNDELGSLTDKFLWMARSLKDKTLNLVSAQKELQTWNSELERRVQDRTKDLKEAQEQLIAGEKLAALGQMASVVGHELRNPLAVMNNSVYFIKTKLAGLLNQSQPEFGLLSPPFPNRDETGLGDDGRIKVQKHLGIIESEIIKSNAIIRDVLDFSRNRALNAAPRKIDELLEKAIERIQIPADVALDKQLTLPEVEVPVDEDELRQVLVNLMENACQAMTSGGRLTVGTKAQGAYAEIVIGDTGCGIPQEHLNKIFAPFFTTKSRGTGLGLAVVKKIIDRHEGRIDVLSKVGEGTKFVIHLPMKGVTLVTNG